MWLDFLKRMKEALVKHNVWDNKNQKDDIFEAEWCDN